MCRSLREKNRSIELNEAGRLLQKRLIPIVSALDRIPGELRADQYMSSHTIHLKLLAASTLITNRIIAYRALRPDVNFQLYQAENHADYDLCVSAVRSDLKNTDYEDYMVMLEEDLYLAVPTHSPYGDKDSINLADTRNAGYICLAGSRPIRQICNSYFSEADFVPNVIFESDTTESVRNLIAAGLGIGFWPQYSWGPLGGEWGPMSPPLPSKTASHQGSGVPPSDYPHVLSPWQGQPHCHGLLQFSHTKLKMAVGHFRPTAIPLYFSYCHVLPVAIIKLL